MQELNLSRGLDGESKGVWKSRGKAGEGGVLVPQGLVVQGVPACGRWVEN